MVMRNAQASNFNPAQLQPADQPSTIPFGPGSGEGQESIRQTPMVGPDGSRYVQQQIVGVDGQPRGAATYISKNPDGSTRSFQPGANGQWVEGQFQKRTIGETIFEDPKLMTFLAVAAGGAAASGAFGGAGGAGGTGLGGGTGATPGVVSGGTSGVGGLGQAGAATTAAGGLAGAGGGGGNNPVAGDPSARYSDASMPNYGGEQSGGGSNSPFGWNDIGKAGNFLADNANWLAPLAGGVAGGLAGMKDQTTSFDRNETSSSQMQGGMNQSTNSSMQGQTGLVDYAQGAGRAYAGMAQDTINGKYLNMKLGTNPFADQDNPYLKSAMDNVATRMTDNYKNGVASQSMGQFAANGAFGGSAHQQFMEGQNRAFGDSLGSAMTGMQMQDYTQRANLKEGQLGRDLNWGINERNNMMNSSGGLSNLGSTQSQNSSQNTTGTNWQNTNGTSNVTGTQTTPGVGFWQGAAGGGLAGWGAYQQSQQPQGGLGMQDPYMQRTVKAY